jgi:peptidoglycan-associated lipoprotein
LPHAAITIAVTTSRFTPRVFATAHPSAVKIPWIPRSPMWRTLSCNFIEVGDAVSVDGKPGRRATVRSFNTHAGMTNRRSMNRPLLALSAAAIAVGCSHSKPQAASPKTSEKPATSAPAAASPNLTVAGDLTQQCVLHFNSTPRAPKFDFDRFELLPEDREVLDQVASCLTTGPLHGRTVQLVGRADPRGTEEYNLGLGTQRADSVMQYLQRRGVSPGQLSQTTRGALDATGKDEAGWREDRRVSLRLASR